MTASTKKIKATTHKDGTVSITISEKPDHQFFSQWNSLGVIEKRIFRKIQWYCRTMSDVFPSQTKLAKDVGCGREHINKTLKKFKDFGWLNLISRGLRRTKRIIMTPHILAMEVSNIKSFTKYEATSKATPITITPDIFSTSKKETGNSPPKKEEGPPKQVERVKPKAQTPKTIDVADYLKQRYNFCYENELKLSLLPQGVVELAVESTKIKCQNKWGIHDPESYAVETALRIAQDRGLRIDWRSYYFTLKQGQGRAI